MNEDQSENLAKIFNDRLERSNTTIGAFAKENNVSVATAIAVLDGRKVASVNLKTAIIAILDISPVEYQKLFLNAMRQRYYAESLDQSKNALEKGTRLTVMLLGLLVGFTIGAVMLLSRLPIDQDIPYTISRDWELSPFFFNPIQIATGASVLLSFVFYLRSRTDDLTSFLRLPLWTGLESIGTAKVARVSSLAIVCIPLLAYIFRENLLEVVGLGSIEFPINLKFGFFSSLSFLIAILTTEALSPRKSINSYIDANELAPTDAQIDEMLAIDSSLPLLRSFIYTLYLLGIILIAFVLFRSAVLVGSV